MLFQARVRYNLNFMHLQEKRKKDKRTHGREKTSANHVFGLLFQKMQPLMWLTTTNRSPHVWCHFNLTISWSLFFHCNWTLSFRSWEPDSIHSSTHLPHHKTLCTCPLTIPTWNLIHIFIRVASHPNCENHPLPPFSSHQSYYRPK